MDIFKYSSCGDIDKVQVPAVGWYGNLVDIGHVDGISDPASEAPRVGHFLCWVSSKLRIMEKSVSVLYL